MTLALAAIFAPGGSGQPGFAKGEIHNLSAPVEVVDHTVGAKTFQSSKLLVKARPETVWRILTDYNNAENIFNNLKDCQLLEDCGNVKIVRHEVQPSGLPGRFKYVLEVKETAARMLEWHRIRGDFREVDGFWKLEPVDGGRHTMVTYSAYINGGLFLPAPLVKRQIRLDMPVVMATLKREAEDRQLSHIARRPEASKSE